MYKIIYLTGAPATGKSTLTENLGKKIPETFIFTYSKELLAWVKKRESSVATQDDLRRESSALITHEDVINVDMKLLELVQSSRKRQNMVIDSHPVTIEKFGFRVTSFSKQQIQKLVPDIIVCLYASTEIIAKRINKNAAGRPLPSPSEIEMHTQLQCQIANMYAFEVNAHLYYLDASHTHEMLLDNFLKVTKIG